MVYRRAPELPDVPVCGDIFVVVGLVTKRGMVLCDGLLIPVLRFPAVTALYGFTNGQVAMACSCRRINTTTPIPEENGSCYTLVFVAQRCPLLLSNNSPEWAFYRLFDGRWGWLRATDLWRFWCLVVPIMMSCSAAKTLFDIVLRTITFIVSLVDDIISALVCCC